MIKRFIFTLFVLFSALTITGQNNYSVWLEKGEDFKVVSETDLSGERNYNYIYGEIVTKSNQTTSAYLQILREQKWWNAPILIHVEFRSFLTDIEKVNNVYLAGTSFEVLDTKAGFFDIQTLYRYDGKNNCQVTLLNEWNYKRFRYSMYADFYGMDKLYILSENRFFFQLCKNIRIGTNIELSNYVINPDGFKCRPLGVLRFDL